jgi:hypothetical protein
VCAPWRGAILALTIYGLSLPGDEVEVGMSRSLYNDQLAGVFELILQLMDTLTADIDLVAQGGIGGPGDTATGIAMDGEGQQQGTGGTSGLRFLEDVSYNRHRHRASLSPGRI